MKKQLLLLLTIICLSSCEDHHIPPPNDLPDYKGRKYAAWLMEKPYVVTTYYFNDQPANDQFLECQLDNILYFYPNGVFLELEGELRCDPAKDTADYGSWSVTSKIFYLNTVNIPNTTFDILSFKRNNFRVISQTDFFPGVKLGGFIEAVE